ncbi:uncharacterized protein Tco025E_04028 [Trypanosoma conorhini]|uniref:LIM zinc-binding domain-containing protein n=1 Tax=Trypanosoma conorhini TaxID=83891 RepID=A0A3R7P9E0_9TRYP|nr:uncharacterized protein Tco025E_04028 [Trypanosoma conorhini]RNF19713.1 hypothetical protein Tco025E_04028 [Trypanosoma conorhini]
MSNKSEEVEEPQPAYPQQEPQQQHQQQEEEEGVEETVIEEEADRGTGGDAVVEESVSVPPPQEQQEEQEQLQDASQEHEAQAVQREEVEADEHAGGPPGIVEVADNNATEEGVTVASHSLPPPLGSGGAQEADGETQSTGTDRRLQMSSTLPPLAAAPVPEEGVVPPLKAGRGAVGQPPTVGNRGTEVGLKYSSFGNFVPPENVNTMTPTEEYMTFRARNGVSHNYRGPVFVVEDIHVMCAECGAPVDPVTRVPAGKLFFHPQCISCKLCRRIDIADAYFQAASNGAICSECASKGFARWVPREAAAARGIVPGAVVGKIDEAVKLYDLKNKLRPSNHSTVAGAVPPTLVVRSVSDPRSQTSKACALVQRQQYYTQNDNNIICMPPASPKRRSRTSSVSRQQGRKEDMPKLM